MLNRPYFQKLAIVVLVIVFLVTSIGSAYGFVICDQGCMSAAHHNNHHKGEESDESGSRPYYPPVNSDDDSCKDYAIQLDSYLKDEGQKYELLNSFAFSVLHYVINSPRPAGLYVNSSNQFITNIISQTLLSHRTVVLLN